MFKPMTGAALALLTACAVQAPTEAHTLAAYTAAPAVDCTIRATKTPHGLKLEALTYTDHTFHGDYDFVVTAKGSGGSSDIRQGGPLDLVAGEEASVGLAELSASRFSASLSVRDDAGEICHAEHGS